MRSSRGANVPKTFLGSKFLRRSFFLGFVALPAAALPQIILKRPSPFFLFALPMGVMLLSQLSYGGGAPFPDAALERFKIRLRRFMFNSQNKRMDVKDHIGGDFKVGRDARREYAVGVGEVQTYGFKVMPRSGEDVIDFYQSFFQQLLSTLDHGVLIKDALMGLRYETEYLRKERPTLIEKGVCEHFRCLFVSFQPTVSEAKKTMILEKLASDARPIKAKEIAKYMELIAAPESPPTGHSTPSYQVSQVLNGRNIKMYPGAKIQGAASLATLPADVQRNYNLILAPVIAPGTIITTTFKLREGLRNNFRNILKGFLKTSKLSQQSEEEVSEAKDAANQESRGDAIDLYMYQSILMYDSPERLQRRILDLQNVRTFQSLAEEAAPVYMGDEGFIEESFRAALPSAWAYLPQRLQDVNSRREASYYLPIEATTSKKPSPLVLRTIRNTPFYVDIESISDKVLIVIDGDTGTGKSTLITLYNKALLWLEENKGIGTGFVSIDIGGTNAWVKDEDGVLAFDLGDTDEMGQPKPWPIHPLHCVLNPDKESYTVEELGLAKQYLAKVMKFKTHTGIAQKAISAALEDMISNHDEYRLSTFVACFQKQFELFKADNSISESMRFEWIEAIMLLENFAKGGVYGHIYDPENTAQRNLNGIYRVYFNVNLGQERIKDLTGFHLQLGYLIGYSLCLRYSSDSGQYRLFHFYADEFKKQAEYIDAEEILELKNQSRKNGFLPIVGVQSLKHLLMDKLDPEKRKEIYEGIRELWIGNVDFNEDRGKLATILNVEDPPRGSKLTGPLAQLRDAIDFNLKVIQQRKSAEQIPDPSEIEREVAKQYTICYISPTREITNLFVDIETNWLWEVTSHAAAKEVRALVMKEFGLKKRAAALILTKILPHVPSSKLSYEELDRVIDRIRKEIADDTYR